MDLANLLQGSAPAPKPYSETYCKRSAQARLSPPVDEPKCSLPSISTLLENADGHTAKRQRLSPSSHRNDHRYDTVRLPPTPPLRPGSGAGHDGRHSHSPIESLNKAPTEQVSTSHLHRSSVSSTGSSTHITTNGPYASPASTVSSYSPIDDPSTNNMYYPRPPTSTTFAPSTHSAPAPGLRQHKIHHHHHQQPQPRPTTSTSTSTSTPQTTTTTTTSSSSSSNPSHITPITPAWQHHHYFPPSTNTPYTQNHDRYICRTCHKAFSRPSSLRIHSHSHTGEKPFRCTHAGCGKAFSVRSNMKRHERGCHSGRPAAAVATALVS